MPTRKGSPLLQIKFVNPELAADLIKHGVTPRKSKTIQWPEVQADLLSHYARGVFDGDGHASRRANGSLTAQITTASKAFADGFKAWADSFTPREACLSEDRNTYVLRWYADNALSLADALYRDTAQECFRLERKYRVFFG